MVYRFLNSSEPHSLNSPTPPTPPPSPATKKNGRALHHLNKTKIKSCHFCVSLTAGSQNICTVQPWPAENQNVPKISNICLPESRYLQESRGCCVCAQRSEIRNGRRRNRHTNKHHHKPKRNPSHTQPSKKNLRPKTIKNT